jgi:flagellin
VTGYTATNIVAGASGITNAGAATTGVNAGAGVSFQITVGATGAPQMITVSRAEVIAANVDFSNGGINSVNLTAALNAKLATAGITTIQALKSGTAGTSAGTDTISLQATTAGPATTFAIASVTGGVIGSTVTLGAGTGGTVYTVDQLVTAINNNANLVGKVRATNNAGQLQISNVSTSALTVTGATGTTIDGGVGTGSIGGNTVRANLVSQFNQLKDQLDKTAADSSFNGINLLIGDQLKLYFNEMSSSTLTIQATNPNGINSTVLGIATATGNEFQDNTQLDTRLQGLQAALGLVASQASDFGSNLSIVQNRQDFTNNMINTLKQGADGLTLADTNEEGANMLALQTRQQLSITALSLASQANQSVLKLFG